ncbi:MAG: hypothetical protein J6O03_01980, partial [Butyrivibrio sp.]|nr:hypothetical protein [Butyrivibrio sp.]
NEKKRVITSSLLKIKQYIKDDVYEEMLKRAEDYLELCLMEYDFEKRGMADYYLEGICYNNVEFLLSMYPNLNGICPYTDAKFLDIAMKYPETIEYVDGTFYKALYNNIDSKLWEIDSTRSETISEEYSREKYSNSEQVMEKVFEAFLKDDTIIDKNKTKTNLEKRRKSGRYSLNKGERWLYAYLLMKEYIQKQGYTKCRLKKWFI